MMRKISLDIFRSEAIGRSAVVLLNVENSVAHIQPHLEAFWPYAAFRGVADGGGNLIRQLCEARPGWPLPHLLSGDFDSITRENLAWFKAQPGVEVKETPDQDFTDFTKHLQILREKMRSGRLKDIDRIVTLGGLSGRFDQVCGAISTLHSQSGAFDVPLFLLQGSSLLTVIGEGRTTMERGPRLEGTCGIVPFRGPSTVSSQGLKWDMKELRLDFAGIISTSNLFEGDELEITCDKPVLATFELLPE